MNHWLYKLIAWFVKGIVSSSSRDFHIPNSLVGPLRIVAGFGTVVFAVAFWMLVRSVRIGPVIGTFCVVTLCGLLICGWYALVGYRPEHQHRLRYASRGAVILGGIGFVVGFFGPLVFARESMPGDLRPLVYPFLTVPVGVAIGAVLGLLFAGNGSQPSGGVGL